MRRSMLARLTDFFFGGDTAALVSHLDGSEPVGREDLKQVRRLIDERESKEGSDG
jgi:hypothetical protein